MPGFLFWVVDVLPAGRPILAFVWYLSCIAFYWFWYFKCLHCFFQMFIYLDVISDFCTTSETPLHEGGHKDAYGHLRFRTFLALYQHSQSPWHCFCNKFSPQILLKFPNKVFFYYFFFKTYGLKNPGDRCECNIFGAEEPRFDIKNLRATERKCNIKNPWIEETIFFLKNGLESPGLISKKSLD